jgi:hypothetical protein
MKPRLKEKSAIAKTIREMLLLGFAVALIYWLLAPDRRPFYPVALEDLRGVWTTSDDEYQDRFLQFTNETVTFGWGAEGAGTYALDDLDSEAAENSTLVHIRYLDLASTDYQFNFHYLDQSGGIIWMKHQQGIHWKRTSTEPTHALEFK